MHLLFWGVLVVEFIAQQIPTMLLKKKSVYASDLVRVAVEFGGRKRTKKCGEKKDICDISVSEHFIPHAYTLERFKAMCIGKLLQLKMCSMHCQYMPVHPAVCQYSLQRFEDICAAKPEVKNVLCTLADSLGCFRGH